MQPITQDILEKAYTYTQYRHLMMKLLSENKTTGPDHSPKMVEHTQLNMKRMDRLDKTIKLQPEAIAILQALEAPLYWVVLAEAWCGDVAQNLPIIAKMADAAPSIELCILLRDEHPSIMDTYLTNGGRSIPKLICLDRDTLAEKWNWGPRPFPAQHMMEEYKSKPEPKKKEEIAKEIHTWYATDQGATLQKEIIRFLRETSAAGNAAT